MFSGSLRIKDDPKLSMIRKLVSDEKIVRKKMDDKSFYLHLLFSTKIMRLVI